MADTVISLMTVAGALALITLPMALWAILGLNSTCRGLEARNAAQAQTIAQMQRRLDAAGAGVREVPPPPRGEWPAMRGDAFPSRAVPE